MARIQVAVTKEQTHRLNALVLVGVLLAFASVVHAERTNTSEERNFGIALPGEKCRILPLPKWTEPEKWAWTQICEGKEANFNERLKEKLDPRNPAHAGEWSDERKLSSIFLETILLHEPFRSAIPRRGVRIIGAYFPNFINLIDASIEQLLLLYKSRFKSQVDMNRLRTPTSISLEGSKFDGDLNMDSISVGDSLLMREAEFGKVVLRGAKIGGQLSMSGATFKGKLNMNAVSVGSSLFMGNAEFGKVDLTGAKIGGQLSMSGATFKGKLNMDSISVGRNLLIREEESDEGVLRGAELGEVVLRGAKIGDQLNIEGATFKGKLNMSTISVGSDLFMRNEAEFDEVDLIGAKIGGQLSMVETTFKGKLDMYNASVGSSLLMRNTEFDKPAYLIFLSVGSNLDVRGATLRRLDLTGSRVEGEIQLGSSDEEKTNWKECKDENKDCHAPKLILRNTSVDALQDTKGVWPDHLEREFEGFTYDRLGGFDTSEQDKPYERGSSWFIEWLAKDDSYSPQPYRHLAGVFRAAGHEDMADDILVANRDRERRETDWWPLKWLWLLALKSFIGYGYGLRYFYALIWVAGLALVGTFILHRAKEEDKGGIKLGFWYSLDMLLPIIHLRERHYTDVDLNTWAKYYFYFHKIMGYVLISFVLAGLSGLTEK